MFAVIFAFGVRCGSPAMLACSCIAALLALLSDSLDGYWARKNKMVTAFGICFDPITDKIFVLCGFAALLAHRALALDPLAFIFMIIREMGVSGLRMMALTTQAKLMPAERFGKLKAALQFTTILVLTVCLFVMSLGYDKAWMPIAAGVLFWLTSGVTLFSGFSYLWRQRRLLKSCW